jgi:hypothetical protein
LARKEVRLGEERNKLLIDGKTSLEGGYVEQLTWI